MTEKELKIQKALGLIFECHRCQRIFKMDTKEYGDVSRLFVNIGRPILLGKRCGCFDVISKFPLILEQVCKFRDSFR